MSNSIFVISDTGTLLPLDQQPFADETSFQKLLESYPELLSGELIDPANPRRWILVRREIGIPDRKGSSTRWSLDHLFLDQDAIPTLVEVKRAQNDEVRRQVVGQILDYAANAVVYWPPGLIRTRFEGSSRVAGKDPDQEVTNRLGIPSDMVEQFWASVEENLRNKKIRMLVVADDIPRELRRIVEFLNEQMSPSVLLALELRHFAGQGVKTLVPVVFGQTEQAIQEKTTRRSSPSSSISDLLNGIESSVGHEVGQLVRDFITWVQEHQFNVRATSKNIYVGVPNKNGQLVEPFSLDTDGKIWCQFGQLRFPFESSESRLAIRDKLTKIPGIELSTADRYPTARMNRLTPESVLGLQYLLNWIHEQVVQPAGG